MSPEDGSSTFFLNIDTRQRKERGIRICVNNATKIRWNINYILVNAWRHVSAVLTDQVQILLVRYIVRAILVPDLYYKLA